VLVAQFDVNQWKNSFVATMMKTDFATSQSILQKTSAIIFSLCESNFCLYVYITDPVEQSKAQNFILFIKLEGDPVTQSRGCVEVNQQERTLLAANDPAMGLLVAEVSAADDLLD
jgi:hypothetical protein